jgi:hypothetical protein
MEKERLKLIVKNLELLVESLKAEVYSDTESYTAHGEHERITPFVRDYDESFDDDGYPD